MPTTQPTRTFGKQRSSGAAGRGPVVPEELKVALRAVGEELVLLSERVLRGLKHGVDHALFRLRAWQIFRDDETKQWVAEVRESLANGTAPEGFEGDELKRYLDERRRHLRS